MRVYYRGDDIFLYVQFKDQQGQLIQPMNPVVSIYYYDTTGNRSVMLNQQPLLLSSQYEYFYLFTIPQDAVYSTYEVIYSGEYNGQTATVFEDFHVIPRSEGFDQAIKVYGYVHQARLGIPLIGAVIGVSTIDGSRVVAQAITNNDGYWEVYVYPDKYKFNFQRYGFNPETVTVQIGSELNEIQFDHISLVSQEQLSKGRGAYRVGDRYITKEGIPLNGLSVSVSNVFDLSTVVAQDVTNDSGEWEVFLDPGTYLLKVNGNSLADDFQQVFRLRVRDDGTYAFENVSNNVGIPSDYGSVGRGNGSITVQDTVRDPKGNPIVDVQVMVYDVNDLNVMIAQDYTDPNGTWTVYLNPGTYRFEYYHPDFNEFTEQRTITT